MRRLIVAAVLAAVSLSPATTAFAGDRPLGAAPAAGLAVYTSPDPSPVASTAYVYSPVALQAPPILRISGPGGSVVVRTVFEKDATPGGWWTAPLPGGVPGIREVDATASTADGTAVHGASSYEIVRPTPSAEAIWHSAGPGAVGGLFAADPSDPRSLYVASGTAAQVYTSHDTGASWRLERTLPVGGGYPTALLALSGHRTRLVLAINGGNGQYVDDPTYTGKVLESDDGGQHWRDLGLPDSFVITVVATPDGSTLIASPAAACRSRPDDGAHWRTVAASWGTASTSGVALIDGDLYVATIAGLYVLRDAAPRRRLRHSLHPARRPVGVDRPPCGRRERSTPRPFPTASSPRRPRRDLDPCLRPGRFHAAVRRRGRDLYTVPAPCSRRRATVARLASEPRRPRGHYTASRGGPPRTSRRSTPASRSPTWRCGYHPLSGVPGLDVYGVTVRTTGHRRNAVGHVLD